MKFNYSIYKIHLVAMEITMEKGNYFVTALEGRMRSTTTTSSSVWMM